MPINALMLLIAEITVAAMALVLIGAWIAYRASRGESPIPLPSKKEPEPTPPPRAKL